MKKNNGYGARVITAGALAYEKIDGTFGESAVNPASGGVSHLAFLGIPVLYDHTLPARKVKISIDMESFEVE